MKSMALFLLWLVVNRACCQLWLADKALSFYLYSTFWLPFTDLLSPNGRVISQQIWLPKSKVSWYTHRGSTRFSLTCRHLYLTKSCAAILDLVKFCGIHNGGDRLSCKQEAVTVLWPQ